MDNHNKIKALSYLTFLAMALAFVFSAFVVAITPQDKPKEPVKQKLLQDTVKLDTVPIKVQQKAYNIQSKKQMSKIDSLIKAKKQAK